MDGGVSTRGRPPAVFLMGPTASGKTELAVALARALPVEIVSVDSAMVYRGMDIGTAKPRPEVLAEAPHRLIDIADPAEAYSAARFRDDALREMAAIAAAGRVPLLVGGTMLYFRALERGLAPMPSADPALRRRLAADLAREGGAALHARLARVDPAAAARIHPNDPQRLLRALEVYELTGRPLSRWQAAGPGEPLPYTVIKLVVAPSDREVLRERIAARFAAMLAAGFEEEVARLRARGDLSPDLPSMRAVGYRQMWAYLEGRLDRAAMEERAVAATRQLAKRQFTWLRAEAGAHWFDALAPDVAARLLDHLAREPVLRRNSLC